MNTPLDLAQAFAETTYRVHLPEHRLDLHIGARHAELDAFLRRLGARSWIVFSPCNPGARLLDEASNAARLAALRARLAGTGLRHFPATGIPPAGSDWPAEPSVLILDPSPAQVRQWAQDFTQLAWVAGELDQPARLVWSSSPRV